MNDCNRVDGSVRLIDGRALAFSEFGDRAGFPIIYCHGSQSSRLEMHYDMSFARAHGLRIITVDRPGHGLSSFNPAGSILSFAHDVKQLTEHLEIAIFSVAGMSAGAPFALGIAYTFPENVRKVSIVSGFAPYTKEATRHQSKGVKTMLTLARRFPIVLRLLLVIQSRQLKRNPQKVLRGFLKIMSDSDRSILKSRSVFNTIENMFIEAFRSGSRGVAFEISRLLVRDWEFELGDIRVPVTIWHGDRDNNVPYEWAVLMKDKIPASRLRLFPNEGHLIIFKHAEDIFLDSKSTTA